MKNQAEIDAAKKKFEVMAERVKHAAPGSPLIREFFEAKHAYLDAVGAVGFGEEPRRGDQ